MHIKITKGLDIPIKGKPEGFPKNIIPSGQVNPMVAPPQIALDLKSFEDIKLKLHVKPGDVVTIGQALAEDKASPGRMFVSPAGGIIKEIRRGLKRSLQDIVIDLTKPESYQEFNILDPEKASRNELLEALLKGGSFAAIRSRPFNLLADPQKEPRNIFVKALESAPFLPPAELQVEGLEKEFQSGLTALSKLTQGSVHLVYRQNTSCQAFLQAHNVERHTAEGPHPISNYSLHIQKIDPIRSAEDIVWTLNTLDVIGIGYLLTHGRYFINRIIGIGGPGILPNGTGFFRARMGYPIGTLIAGRIQSGWLRFVSGDPLMGRKVAIEDFLGFEHTALSVIPENADREFLHFMGLGIQKYSFSRAYLSGHLNNQNRDYFFSTNQHGEHRAFIDSTLYDKVMPLQIPTMLLVKAIMAEDFELADTFGILEVDSEDFALPTFVCPSKMEMTEIVKTGLKHYAKEVLI